MMMTSRRLAVIADRARFAPPPFAAAAVAEFGQALNQRAAERGPSKLARRITRKRALGMAGAF